MNRDNILDIIAKYLKVEKKDLNLNASFKNDLHLDSIDLFQIVMEIESTYNVKIKNEDLLNINTIKDALDKFENAK